MNTAHTKPAGCRGCALETLGTGYVPGIGPHNADIAFLLEAPGYDEVAIGQPAVGQAGGMLTRILQRNQWSREQFYIDNTYRCCPPAYEIKDSWAESAALHCSQYTQPALDRAKVVVTQGATALRKMLNLWGQKGIKVENFHGTVHRLPNGQAVVPTYHPSFLQRGAHNLIGVVSFDLQVAHEVARGEYQQQPIDTVIDPPIEWFRAWADHLLALYRHDPSSVWLGLDCETPDKAAKDENELTLDDKSFKILRTNLAYHPDEGITVPNDPLYMAIVKELVESGITIVLWNAEYDLPRYAAVDIIPAGRVLDIMWLAHVLNSDIPLGLGFWAPFYSRFGAWKHLAHSEPGYYAAIDPAQTLRVGYGVVGDLKAAGQWEMAQRHVEQLYWKVLKPAQWVGVPVNRQKLDDFIEDLTRKTTAILSDIQATVPESDRPLRGGVKNQGFTSPPEGLHPEARTTTLKGAPKVGAEDADPVKLELYAHARVVGKEVARLVRRCQSCGQVEVVAKHRCHDKKLQPQVELMELPVPRWFWLEPFNPNSPQQILQYAKSHSHRLVLDRKTKKATTNRDALKEMSRTSRDPLYDKILDLRAVVKVRGTYGIGVRNKLDEQDRFHPTPTFRPSTMRLSYVSPNITNVVADKGGDEGLAAGFRNVIEAAPGCWIVEVDFSGIEAVVTGWFAEDPNYIRLAKLGVHAYLASHLLNRPADLTWSDNDLAAYFKELKATFPEVYDTAKRAVHGTNYGLTPHGAVEKFPRYFKNLRYAQQVFKTYGDICPKLPALHRTLRELAYQQGYVGGPGPIGWKLGEKMEYQRVDRNAHPYGYRHYFWSVMHYRPISDKTRINKEKKGEPVVWLHGRPFAVDWGEDAKRVLAFPAQSTARGVLTEAMLRLFADPSHPSYIGDTFYGYTPLRAPIHDSLLMEVPDERLDDVFTAVFREMLRPVEALPLPAAWNMGSHLAIGVEAKAGRDWGRGLSKVPTPSLAAVGLANDLPASPIDADEAEQESWEELQTRIA